MLNAQFNHFINEISSYTPMNQNEFLKFYSGFTVYNEDKKQSFSIDLFKDKKNKTILGVRQHGDDAFYSIPLDLYQVILHHLVFSQLSEEENSIAKALPLARIYYDHSQGRPSNSVNKDVSWFEAVMSSTNPDMYSSLMYIATYDDLMKKVTVHNMSELNYEKMMNEVRSIFHGFPKGPSPSQDDDDYKTKPLLYCIDEAPTVVITSDSMKRLTIEPVLEISQDKNNTSQVICFMKERNYNDKKNTSFYHTPINLEQIKIMRKYCKLKMNSDELKKLDEYMSNYLNKVNHEKENPVGGLTNKILAHRENVKTHDQVLKFKTQIMKNLKN
jgi:hypothetical protein